MRWALYDPQWGYYSQGEGIFGQEGDFITAPELTGLFGRTLGRAILPVLQTGLTHIYEFGAGRGKLALDLLCEIGDSVSHYTIVELSGSLREAQRALLHQKLPASIFDKVSWIEELPDRLDGIVVTNELLDAIPVRRFKFSSEEISEAYVDLKNEQLHMSFKVADQAMKNHVQALEAAYGPWPEGFTSEWAEQVHAFVRTITEKLEGVCLMVDYGMDASQYYQASHQQGHLRAHSRHTAHDDFLIHPGQQDLTSHVNFTDVYDAVVDADGQLEGYSSQGNFLLQHGLLELAQKEPDLTHPTKGGPLRQALNTLTSEAAMGLSFKVMCWSRGFELQEGKLMTGFLSADLSHQL